MTGGLPAVLAIDGGNSKTDVALVAADGQLLGMATGPGMTSFSGLADWLVVLAGLTGQVQQQAGLRGQPIAAHISACVANADLPEEEERLAVALRARGWSATTEAVNDTFAVLRAGLDDDGRPWGVAVTCGAGINCVGVDAAGRTATFLALGAITGDWGGGHGLGLAALWHGMRADDGRGPATALAGVVASHFGLPSVRDVAIAIHLGALSEHDLVRLAPAVLAAADEGDQVAVRLLHRQAEEICLMALTAMRRLDLTGLATPVVLGGGLMAARNPLLTAQIAAGIAAGAPRAIVRTVDVPPVVGAALLGLDHAGAPPDAEHRLRATCSGKVRL